MSQRSLYVTASRLLGLYLAVMAAKGFAQGLPALLWLAFGQLPFPAPWFYSLAQFGPPVVYAVGAFYMVRHARSIAGVLAGDRAEEELPVYPSEDIEVLAFRFAGILFTAQGLPNVSLASMHTQRFGPWPFFAGVVVPVLFGLLLLFTPRRVLRVVTRLDRGQPTPSPDSKDNCE